MRRTILSAGVAVVVISPSALAQESLCNPCVDPPTLNNFGSSNAVSVITAEDMRALGIVSIADMIDRLPEAIAREAIENSEESESSSDEEHTATSQADSQPSGE